MDYFANRQILNGTNTKFLRQWIPVKRQNFKIYVFKANEQSANLNMEVFENKVLFWVEKG